MQTRNDKILAFCNLDGLGLEISPSYNPVLPKARGYRVETLDVLDKEGLRRHYTGHNVNLDNIEDVDYVLAGNSYADAVGKTDCYDFIIASHVIEHVLDIIGFFKDCVKLLKPYGVLSLVVPDKRYCFDFFRPLTLAGSAINSAGETKKHSLGVVVEHFLHTGNIDMGIAWGKNADRGKIHLNHTTEQVKGMIDLYRGSPDGYIDAHRWVFTKSSFELLFNDLVSLDFLSNIVILKSYDVEGCEFYISLQKVPDDAYIKPPFDQNERLGLLMEIERELRETPIKTGKRGLRKWIKK